MSASVATKCKTDRFLFSPSFSDSHCVCLLSLRLTPEWSFRIIVHPAFTLPCMNGDDQGDWRLGYSMDSTINKEQLQFTGTRDIFLSMAPAPALKRNLQTIEGTSTAPGLTPQEIDILPSNSLLFLDTRSSIPNLTRTIWPD